MASVDVVVPCYKYGRYLRDCVQSVLIQQGVDVRVLIIDDCSPDNTPEVAQQLCDEDSRVEYRRHAENKGHIATYNEGLLGWASADACLLLSADDLLAPGALARAIAVLEMNSNVGFVYGHVLRFLSLGDLPADRDATHCPTVSIERGIDFIAERCRKLDNPVYTPSVVVRTTIQHTIGGYDIALPHAGDLDMWLRLAAVTDVGCIRQCQAYYRWHSQNMTHVYLSESRQDLPVRDLQQRLETFARLFDANRNRNPSIAALEHDANSVAQQQRRHLACTAIHYACEAYQQGNDALCTSLVRTAVCVDPRMIVDRDWLSFQLKFFLGRRITSALKWILARVRVLTP